MTYRLFGVFLVVLGCGTWGCILASKYRQECKTLEQLLHLLQIMESELQYHMTPLPDLCLIAADSVNGIMHDIFTALSQELNQQISPNVSLCMRRVLSTRSAPIYTNILLEKLGKTLGRFDYNGQLKGIEAVHHEAQCKLATLMNNQDARIRSYRTFGLCAGLAIVILLI